MPDLGTLLTFAAAVLAMQVVPGPDIALLVSRGVGQGQRVALWTAVGMTVGAGAIQLPLLAFGLASVIQSSPVALGLLNWLGAAYLIWLGTRLLRTAGHPGGSMPAARQVAPLTAACEGMINNLTNPKVAVFMVAFLPLFVNPAHGPVSTQLLVLGAVQKMCGMVVLGTVALISGTVGGWVARKPHLIAWQERFTGVVMIALGLRLLLGGDARPARV